MSSPHSPIRTAKIACRRGLGTVSLLLAMARAVAAGPPPYNFSTATAQLAENLDLYGPGVAASIEQRGLPIFSYQSGSITLTSKQGIASCSKWLSGAIVLILAEQGYFDLDDRIGEYLPVFEAAGKGHPTLRQCFAMTSGFYQTELGYEIDRTLTLEESVNLIAANVPIVFPPGTQLAYEGAGMQIVGRICEVVTGKSWHTLAAGLLFQPLGMRQSDYLYFDPNPAIAGGARSTAEDYLKFLRMILGNGAAPDGTVILSSRSVQEFFTNQTPGLTEYHSPWPLSLFYPYQTRPDYGMGSWIQAQPGAGAPVEEVSSPGAFGTYPWVDRKRGLTGIIFTFKLAGLSALPNNNIRILSQIRTEIDRVGLPAPADFAPLSISPLPQGRLRLDWGGGGRLETTTNLQDWNNLPVPFPPFIENPGQSGQPAAWYRVVP
ncbi:MAG: serine hydrolase domain-containing protein [Verrucomicrobiota bacterium]